MTTYIPHPNPRPGDLVWVQLAVPGTPHHVYVIAEVVDRRGSQVEVRFFHDSTCAWLPLGAIRKGTP